MVKHGKYCFSNILTGRYKCAWLHLRSCPNVARGDFEDRHLCHRPVQREEWSGAPLQPPSGGSPLRGHHPTLLWHFKKTLPSVADTKVNWLQRKKANQPVQLVLDKGEPGLSSWKWKAYGVYKDEDRACIDRYASEKGNELALKPFRSNFPPHSESTVHGFKSNYLAPTKEVQTGEVTAMPPHKCGRPSTLGQLDSVVQDCFYQWDQ